MWSDPIYNLCPKGQNGEIMKKLSINEMKSRLSITIDRQSAIDLVNGQVMAREFGTREKAHVFVCSWVAWWKDPTMDKPVPMDNEHCPVCGNSWETIFSDEIDIKNADIYNLFNALMHRKEDIEQSIHYEVDDVDDVEEIIDELGRYEVKEIVPEDFLKIVTDEIRLIDDEVLSMNNIRVN